MAIDIIDPTDPIRVGNYDTFPGPVSLFDGNWGVYPLLGLDRVLASDLDGGLFVLDATALGAGQRQASDTGIQIVRRQGVVEHLQNRAALVRGEREGHESPASAIGGVVYSQQDVSEGVAHVGEEVAGRPTGFVPYDPGMGEHPVDDLRTAVKRDVATLAAGHD